MGEVGQEAGVWEEGEVLVRQRDEGVWSKD